MKEFRLSQMFLLSLREKKGKRVKFDPRRTIVLGRNSTGKSCLLKSIYQTFGAEPHNIHPNWAAIDPISLVIFTIDRQKFHILRNGKTYCLFDSEENKIEQFQRVSELAIFLAELMDFKIQLKNREGELVTPPPAYFFLPYYLDQDKSWNSNWSSFTKLYLPNTRTDIANYHTGIKPNAFYTTKGELSITNDQIGSVDKELAIIRNLLKTLKNKMSEVEFSIDLGAFEAEVRELMISCKELNSIQNNLKHQLSHLSSRRINLEAQLTITRNALLETQMDYEYAVNDLPGIVLCPSCGAEYENSFAERFGIALDEQQCYNLTLELQEEINALESEVESVTKKYYENDKLTADIEKALEAKQHEIKLRDVIESEGKKEVQNMLQKEIESFDNELRERLLLKKTLEDRLGQIEDKNKSARIKDQYIALMRRFLQQLNIYTLNERSYKRIDSTIKESGSTTPRALMAYYYSILHVIKTNGSSAFCPIVIDSPNQQGQDRENLPLLLNFIVNNQPNNSQLILALEETHNIDFTGEIIELTHARSLLSEEEYSECFDMIKPFLDQIQTPGIQTSLF